MNILGWDIGGANLKVSDGESHSAAWSFPLWQAPELLSTQLVAMARRLPPARLWAVTMTAELADCFQTKREGVHRILKSVQAAAGDLPVQVWTTGGEFVSVEEAAQWPLLTAASNWQALATWVGRMVPAGEALLIDSGSTTTDLIPLRSGFPNSEGRTDVERLQAGELVYTGWKRTPIAAIAQDVDFRGRRCPLAAERFATAWDIHLLCGHVTEGGDDDTANGGPPTIDAAHDRLARMLCCDREELNLDDARSIARELASRQVDQIRTALEAVIGRMQGNCSAVIQSGSGEFLAQAAVQTCPALAGAEVYSLATALGDAHTTAACAYAVARLASERVH